MEITDHPIVHLNLGSQEIAFLRRAGISTLGELCDRTEPEIVYMVARHAVNPRIVRNLRLALQENNLSFREE